MRHGFRAPQDPAFPRFRTDLPMPSGRSQTLQHRLSFIRSLRVVRLQVIARPAFLSFFSRRVPLPKDPFVSTAVQQMTVGR